MQKWFKCEKYWSFLSCLVVKLEFNILILNSWINMTFSLFILLILQALLKVTVPLWTVTPISQSWNLEYVLFSPSVSLMLQISFNFVTTDWKISCEACEKKFKDLQDSSWPDSTCPLYISIHFFLPESSDPSRIRPCSPREVLLSFLVLSYL